LIIATTFLFTSCEEVIELDLDQYEKRVVIDANIFSGEKAYNKIKVYYSAPFYANGYQYIETAEVTIKDIISTTAYKFNYTEKGLYENYSFQPEVNKEYELEILFNGAVYKAKSFMTLAPEIINVEQINDSGLLGDNIEIRFNYQDNADTEDFYLTQIEYKNKTEFNLITDKIMNGNIISDIFFFEEEDKGRKIQYSLAKIDKNYYNYLKKLFSNSASDGNPFATPTGTLKGNIINTTNTNDFPLGYFHIANRQKISYTIQ